MKPTNELRFVVREMSVPWQSNPEIAEVRHVQVLQQKWADFVSTGPLKIDVEYKEQWRDVPVEVENRYAI